jgi:hypothetical protein
MAPTRSREMEQTAPREQARRERILHGLVPLPGGDVPFSGSLTWPHCWCQSLVGSSPDGGVSHHLHEQRRVIAYAAFLALMQVRDGGNACVEFGRAQRMIDAEAVSCLAVPGELAPRGISSSP